MTGTLTIRHLNGAQITLSLTKVTYDMNPVSPAGQSRDRLRRHAGRLHQSCAPSSPLTAEDQLRARIKEFKDQGIDKVIIDLRYNGGGLIDVSQVLGSLLAANQVNKPFAYMTFSPSQSSNNETLNFQAEANAIARPGSPSSAPAAPPRRASW